MLVVIDTNIFISYLITPSSQPAKIISLWKNHKFQVLTAQAQIDELTKATRYPRIKERVSPAHAGRFINELRELATFVDYLPTVRASQDPHDNYLLSIASGGLADYLVTGDKKDLLSLKRYDGTTIVTVADFLIKNRFIDY